MKAMMILMMLFSIVTSVHAGECSEQDWVKESSRTQAGGWIWFPGQGTSSDLAKANLMANGSALEYLVNECGVPHVETKFHEKCVEKGNGKYTVFVRAAIKEIQCREGKYDSKEFKKGVTSSELKRTLNNYRAMLSNSVVDKRACSFRWPENCFDMADREFRLDNPVLASAYAKIACEAGNKFACGFNGYLQMELGNTYEAIEFLEKGCSAGYEIYCKDLVEARERQGL